MRNQEKEFSLLYVEDDEFLREQYSDFFQLRVDILYKASNGEEGLELYKKYSPDIVVTDLLMPVMDGIEMIREIKKINPNTKIMITTAYSDVEYMLNAIELNITKYILKPMKGRVLNGLINELKEVITLERDKQKYSDYVETIINTQPSMVILNIERDIVIVNKSFLNFLGFNSLESFKKVHKCICDLFEKDEEYFYNKGFGWLDKAIEKIKGGEAVEVKIKDEIFSILISQIPEKHEYVITLSNITIQKKFELALREKVQEEIEKNKRQQAMLIQQSKLATMGEMISAIAHQWRQPLNAIGLNVQEADMKFQLGEMSEEYFSKVVDAVMKQLNYMSHTIDDFRNFYKPNKEKQEFCISKSVKNTLYLVEAQLKNDFIKIDFINNSKQEFIINSFESEFQQAILNFINNSKDAIKERQEKIKELKGYIKIVVNSISDSEIEIKVIDNGGGIDEKIMNSIFEPYFSTKNKLQGSGLGLYMSKMVIENSMNGKIDIKNIDDGLEIRVVLNRGTV